MIAHEDIDTLEPAQMREALRTLVAEVALKNERIERVERESAFKQATIDKLTHEMAVLKRLKFAAQSEAFNTEQRSLLDETIDTDLAALAAEIEQAALRFPGCHYGSACTYPVSKWHNAQIWMIAQHSASPPTFQSIESGVHVAPFFYAGSSEPRFFIYVFTPVVGSCQNTNCPGLWVHTSNALPIGGVYSFRDPPLRTEKSHAWYRDPVAPHNWYLFSYDASTGTYTEAGYYDGTIFSGVGLANYATQIHFGAEAWQNGNPWYPPYSDPTVTMGSGINPRYWSGSLDAYVAYQRNMQYLDATGLHNFVASFPAREVPLDGSDPLYPAVGCAYGLIHYPAASPYQPGWGASIFYGGNGVGSGAGC